MKQLRGVPAFVNTSTLHGLGKKQVFAILCNVGSLVGKSIGFLGLPLARNLTKLMSKSVIFSFGNFRTMHKSFGIKTIVWKF